MYITADLLDGLLSMAVEQEPEAVVIDLGATTAGELSVELDSETPVLSHFYLPTDESAVSAVFGLDLGNAPGSVAGRFISRPTGELSVRATDELHARLLVAIPPWTEDDVGGFDQRGQRHSIRILEDVSGLSE